MSEGFTEQRERIRKMKRMNKPKPKCVICNKPVNILVDKYSLGGWEHNKCEKSCMIPSILNDSQIKPVEHSEEQKWKAKQLKEIIEYKDLCVRNALCEQKKQIRERVTKKIELLREEVTGCHNYKGTPNIPYLDGLLHKINVLKEVLKEFDEMKL